MSTAGESTSIGTLVLLLASMVIVIASISMIRVLRFIWSGHDGRPQRARQMLCVSIRRIVVTLAALIMLGIAWRYWQDARLRAACSPRDQVTEYSPDGRYVAKYCYFRDTIILRLYGKDNMRLRAERTYRDTSGVLVSLTWTENSLTYPDGDVLKTINLPPSLYDRILTQLP
ncbi:hypothetical protein [Burkholderia metallica]|uniref:DUF3592 domain-containing protein n=1 Tax=Burkholderia metallica TaxID=488729 RepID=A0ABT8PMZ9_9BURK|nr:hypothetical protein [Burkholderia metallica]AOJ32813.1 hypothetical protein WJ16_15450 [Burkholderia metallica]MDN7936521.1 hypothetical protein [Burkholderia metallica]